MASPTDTSAEARRLQLAILRGRAGAERVAMAFEMSESARALTEAGIRDRHPEWTDPQVHAELLARMLGRTLANEVLRARLEAG